MSTAFFESPFSRIVGMMSVRPYTAETLYEAQRLAWQNEQALARAMTDEVLLTAMEELLSGLAAEEANAAESVLTAVLRIRPSLARAFDASMLDRLFAACVAQWGLCSQSTMCIRRALAAVLCCQRSDEFRCAVLRHQRVLALIQNDLARGPQRESAQTLLNAAYRHTEEMEAPEFEQFATAVCVGH